MPRLSLVEAAKEGARLRGGSRSVPRPLEGDADQVANATVCGREDSGVEAFRAASLDPARWDMRETSRDEADGR